MRKIITHHDGHGLNELTEILANDPGVGGAPDSYQVRVGEVVTIIQFQAGPRHEPGSTPGILEAALLAIVADRMRGFNDGPYKCRQNALVLTKIQEALHWLRDRADERKARGVLGTKEK